MGSKIAVGATVLTAVALVAGCSSAASSHPSAADQPTSAAQAPLVTSTTSAIGDAPTSAGSAAATDATASAPATLAAATSPTSSSATSSAAAQTKPVSALLAHIAAPVNTNTMPKAQAAWIAAVQKTMDDGTPILKNSGVSVNLMALVDEAAKTSDLDALVKLCYLCTDPAAKASLTTAMQQKDSTGRSGFAQLSFLLEHTHPGQPYSQSPGAEFPGFASPTKKLDSTDSFYSPTTDLDRSDMKAFGLTTGDGYHGIKVTFENLNDGPNGWDGWDGLVGLDN